MNQSYTLLFLMIAILQIPLVYLIFKVLQKQSKARKETESRKLLNLDKVKDDQNNIIPTKIYQEEPNKQELERLVQLQPRIQRSSFAKRQTDKIPVIISDQNIPKLKESFEVKKIISSDYNPVDKLPYPLALPFYAADKAFDISTTIAAESIRYGIFLPIKIACVPIKRCFRRT